MLMFKNNRHHTRYPVIEKLSLRFENEFLNGTECSNISLGGMCILIDDKISSNDKYGTLMLAQKMGDDIILFEADFVRLWDRLAFADSDDRRMGIKFINIDKENHKKLLKIISTQDKMEYNN